MKRGSQIAAITMLVALISACGGPGSLFGVKKNTTGDAITVAASFYPIAEIVSRVGGVKVSVVNLTPAGTDAHEVELTAKQLQELQDAKITFYLGENYQPSVQKAISSLKGSSVDLLTVVPTSGFSCDTCEINPHVWLDPANMILMTRQVEKSLSASRPELATYFSEQASAFVAELTTLGNSIDAAFTQCESTTLVTAHDAFHYLAQRAHLGVYSVAHITPDAQLSAQELEKLIATLQSKKVFTVFSEELIDSPLVVTVAQKLGATTDTLNPLEGLTNADIKAGKNYITVQGDNIARIAKGLKCS
jgi:zinc transport system substrate-binding protein